MNLTPDEEKCGCVFMEKMCWKHKKREVVKMSCNNAKRMVNLWANPFDPPGRPLKTTRPPTFGEILQFRKGQSSLVNLINCYVF